MKLPAPLAPHADAIKVAAVAALAFALFMAGWTLQGWRMDRKLARVEADHAQAVARSQQAYAADLRKALDDTEAATRRTKELQDELEREKQARAAVDAVWNADRERLRGAIAAGLAARCAPARAAAAPGGVPPAAGARGVPGESDFIGLLGALEATAGAAIQRGAENRARALKLERWVDTVAIPTCSGSSR